MRWFITGGAGFIGCNAATRLSRDGHEVVVFDNLARKGTNLNARSLSHQPGVRLHKGDVRNYEALCRALRGEGPCDVVLHLAGQVAVTASVVDPRTDFESNALGTFNVCEAVRNYARDAIFLNASTNKVYGPMEDLMIVERDGRYAYADTPWGVSEKRPVDFHTPYGCSKGAADQYVCNWARIYDLQIVNFRQFCIYGTRQFGVEDQGWVAWFIIAAARTLLTDDPRDCLVQFNVAHGSAAGFQGKSMAQAASVTKIIP